MSQTTNNNESNEENTNVVSNPSTTTTRKRKRKNSNNVESSEPLTKKKSTKKLTKSESTLIANAYKYHNGNYAKIYKDRNIVKLKKTNQQIYNHIQYLKNKKNRTISTGRSDEAREDILDAIVESNLEGVDGMEQTLSSYVASDHESDDESEYETPLTPELPNNLQAIHDQDRSDLDDSVNSENISSASDFTTHSQKITDRQKIRTAKIRQKEKERNTILDDIRQQQQERKEATDFKQMMMLSIMQQQQMFQALMMKLFAIPLPNNPDSNVFNLFATSANNVNNSNTEQNSNNNTTQQL